MCTKLSDDKYYTNVWFYTFYPWHLGDWITQVMGSNATTGCTCMLSTFRVIITNLFRALQLMCQVTMWPKRHALSVSERHQTVQVRGGGATHFSSLQNVEAFIKWLLLVKCLFSLFFHLSTLKKNLLYKYPQQCFSLFSVLFLGMLTYVKRLMGVAVIQAGTVLYALM